MSLKWTSDLNQRQMSDLARPSLVVSKVLSICSASFLFCSLSFSSADSRTVVVDGVL